jgi:hypothetical protein
MSPSSFANPFCSFCTFLLFIQFSVDGKVFDDRREAGPNSIPRLHKENIAGRQMLIIEIGATTDTHFKLGMVLSMMLS